MRYSHLRISFISLQVSFIFSLAYSKCVNIKQKKHLVHLLIKIKIYFYYKGAFKISTIFVPELTTTLLAILTAQNTSAH